MNTDSLIEKSLTGDKDAFACLFNTNRQAIKQLLISLSNNEFDSNDMLQDTFIKAFLNLSKYKNEFPFNVWLTSIARNTFFDHVRRKAVKNSVLNSSEFSYQELEESAEQKMIKEEKKEQIIALIENLPDKYRKILELRYYKGMDYHKISAVLNIPEGTVKTNLFRAKNELKKSIMNLM